MRHLLAVPGALAVLTALMAMSGSGSAVLELRITDSATGQPAACNVLVTAMDGRSLVEPAPSAKGARSAGTFRREFPAGPVHIRVSRGFETPAVERDAVLQEGVTSKLDITLERSIDLRARGWYSGDSHTHMIHGERTIVVGFDDVALAAQAEDLAYLSLGQTWNVDEAKPERLDAELGSRSSAACLLTWTLESPKNYYRGDATRCLGHGWALGMSGRTDNNRDVIELLGQCNAHDYEAEKATYANFDSHALIHRQGGGAFYTHPLRWWEGPWGGRAGYPRQEKARVSNMAVELPLDVLVGPTFDGVDVMTGTGEPQADAGAFELWALLLNHGYRLSPTGSSDSCFDRPHGATPGSARTYSFTGGPFSIGKAKQATIRGATFATTGPLLLVSADGMPPGTQLRADGSDHRLVVEAWASGEDPGKLTRVEILRNGRVWKEFSVNARTFRDELTITERENAWYCARATGSRPDLQRAVSGAFFFTVGDYRPNDPVPARVTVTVVDANTGENIRGAQAEEIFFDGPIPRLGKEHRVPAAHTVLTVPGTARIRVSVPGYSPQTLSPYLDNPPLMSLITRLAADDLKNWSTFERIQDELSRVQLTFRLTRTTGRQN